MEGVRTPEYFALRVQGDSMNAVRIQEGDLIIVRQQDEVENGEIAVVLVGDDEATVKRFYATDSTITLMPQSTSRRFTICRKPRSRCLEKS